MRSYPAIVTYCRFHQNTLELQGSQNLVIPISQLLASTTACITMQAVMYTAYAAWFILNATTSFELVSERHWICCLKFKVERMVRMLQGQPRDHNEYVIYDKRRALIEYVVFYSTPSVHLPASESDVQEAQLVGETVSDRDVGASRHDLDDSRSGSSSPVSGGSSPASGRGTPHSDVGADDVLPVAYESVRRVSAVRQRSQALPTRSGMSTSLQLPTTYFH